MMIKVMEAGTLQLAVLASGRGSNFDAICQAIERGELDATVKILISDKDEAPALAKATQWHSDLLINPRDYTGREAYEELVVESINCAWVNLVVLAGYMRLVGKVLLEAYRQRILNIHPALLPSFTGLHAQQQALDYGVKFSGCTVHLVDAGMDTGPIIIQAVVPVYQDDNEESLITEYCNKNTKYTGRLYSCLLKAESTSMGGK